MVSNPGQLEKLLEKLETLSKRQELFQAEINELRREIERLKSAGTAIVETSGVEPIPRTSSPPLPPEVISPGISASTGPKTVLPGIRSDIEKFIGENLISKIGIAITVIGVGIGTKYAIDHRLISPLMRIVLGYMIGAVLLGFSFRLREKFKDFSAVLLSGAMAILYFITYAAHDFYSLLPQVPAFGLMVLFTVFTVMSAIRYDRQVIAHIGLVGAYAVPFLLSEGSGRADILFSYMAIINTGILAIAFRKYWKVLYYAAFGLTWLIFNVWYFSDYRVADHFTLSLIFISIFFTLFYITFLAYKLARNEKFSWLDIVLLLANSFIFYGLGYSILDGREGGEKMLGLFTLVNAGLHLIVGLLVYRRKLADPNLFYLVAGLVLIFITIAIPVQLDGNWVTMLWTGEAVLLFWIGITTNTGYYQKISFPLMFFAFMSLIQDLSHARNEYAISTGVPGPVPFLNIHFLGSLIFILAFAVINMLYFRRPGRPGLFKDHSLNQLITFSVPAILLIGIYYSLWIELGGFLQRIYAYNIEFKSLWLYVYTFLFFSLLGYINLSKIKSQWLGFITLGFSALVLTAFMIEGLVVLGQLRERFIASLPGDENPVGAFAIGIRYVVFAVAGVNLAVMNRYIRQEFIKNEIKIIFDLFLHMAVLCMVSNELIQWMDIYRSPETYKLGMSVLWGIYALFLIVLGIWMRKKHLRLAAIILFGITLLKLFFYDLTQLDTLSKTIIFLSLGALLLIISFLYNKYRHLIT